MKNYLKTMLACVLVIFLYNCEGEDGAIGPTGEKGVDGTHGIDGTDGVNGTDATNGTDGTNGVGFDELAKYGNIKINLSGTRPDGVAFTDNAEFKFTPTETWQLPQVNSKRVVNNTVTEYRLQRFLNLDSGGYADIHLRTINAGEANQDFEFKLAIKDYAIITDDHKYFAFDNEFYTDYFFERRAPTDPITNFNITDFNFDDTTNSLTFSFSFDVPELANDTRHDLTVSGEVNVIVLEEIHHDERD